MIRRDILLFTTALLFGVVVMAATTDHQALLEACVCVVNAMARAILALGISMLAGMVPALVQRDPNAPGMAVRLLGHLQVLAFIVALFFLIQYVYFLLEIVQ